MASNKRSWNHYFIYCVTVIMLVNACKVLLPFYKKSLHVTKIVHNAQKDKIKN